MPQGHGTGPSWIMPLPQLKQPILHTGTRRFSPLTVPKPTFPDADLQKAPCLSSSGHFPQRCLSKAQQRGPLPPQPQEPPGSQAHLRGTAALPRHGSRGCLRGPAGPLTHQVRPPAPTQTPNSGPRRGHPAPPCRCGERAPPGWGPHLEAQGQPHMASHARGDEAAVWRVTREGRAGPGTPRRRDRAAPQPPAPRSPSPPGARQPLEHGASPGRMRSSESPRGSLSGSESHRPQRAGAPRPPQGGRSMAHYFAAASPALRGAVERQAGPAAGSGAAATGEAGRGRSGALPAGYST